VDIVGGTRIGTIVLDEHVMDVLSIRPTGGKFRMFAIARGPMKGFSGSGWVLFGDDGQLVASNTNRKARINVPDLKREDTLTLTLDLDIDYVREGATRTA
jgi:hypothetical protein